jgi:transmembrane sensor
MKYSKIDIRNTVRNLIDYFKMQNEVPSQKEIVEVWSKIKEGVEKKKQRRKERYILVAITSAAAFIGCIWLGIEWYSFNNKSDISVIAVQMSNESIEGEDIRLIVSEKEVHHVKKGATVA